MDFRPFSQSFCCYLWAFDCDKAAESQERDGNLDQREQGSMKEEKGILGACLTRVDVDNSCKDLAELVGADVAYFVYYGYLLQAYACRYDDDMIVRGGSVVDASSYVA